VKNTTYSKTLIAHNLGITSFGNHVIIVY